MVNGNSKYEKKTYVITSAQGIQNPHSAKEYGRDELKGEPNKPLIKNIEKYVKENQGDLKILAVAGSYVNEIELSEGLQKREDVYMDKITFKRLEAKRELERERRRKWEEQKEVAEGKKKEFNKKCPMYYFWENIPDKIYPDIETKLNSKIGIIGLPEPSQNRDPTSGNMDLPNRLEESIIFGHPKQRLKPSPKNQNGKFPRLVITPGCCTYPNYNATNTRGNKAERDHQYGFAVVDVLDDKTYLPRLVPAREDGTFIDLGMKYSNGKDPEKVRVKALILGDIHLANLDALVMQANNEMIDFFHPEELYIHDIFDAQSINVHGWEDKVEEMINYEKGLTNLEEEISDVYSLLVDLSVKMGDGKVRVVASNHDDMLYRWLARGKYQGDKENKRFAYKILAKIEKNDWPLEIAVKTIGNLPTNVEFLSLTSDYKPWGYQCSAHGDKGVNGSKGSLKSLASAYGRVIIGHTHQLEVLGNSISVGTSSKIPMEYQQGQPTTSMAGNAVIYEKGLIQALPIIYGKWKK